MSDKRMPQFVVKNIRLQELAIIVEQNKPFFEAFLQFLQQFGYPDLASFIGETDFDKAYQVIETYLSNPAGATLYDGLGRPYKNGKAKWYFLAWILRDAPVQRLEPLLKTIPGDSVEEKKALLLNQIREFVAPLLPNSDKWTWPVISEIMLARLEGSRRALKGTHFENVVRYLLKELFESKNIPLKVGQKQIVLGDETYDVQVIATNSQVLMPVKTRETMGGGHANLFTRDIFKSVTVAQQHGYTCIPIVIAESWTGKLDTLNCPHLVYIQANPNQLEQIMIRLADEFEHLLPFWLQFSEG